jgi:hypothetical protein
MHELFSKLDLDLNLKIIGEVCCLAPVDVEGGEACRPLSTLAQMWSVSGCLPAEPQTPDRTLKLRFGSSGCEFE